MVWFRHGGDRLIAQLSRTISSLFIARGIIPEDDKEVYVYSFEILLSTLMNLLVLVFLSLVTRTGPETALYLLGFLPLRLIAGGYHARSHFRCFLILLFSYTAFLLLICFLPISLLLPCIIISFLVSVVLVFAFAPSEDDNKPLSNEEINLFKRRSRLCIAGYAAIICLLSVFIDDMRFAFSIAIGIFTVAMSLLVNFIKNENSKNKKSCCMQKGVN